jgi:hypothetical protein
MGDYAPCRDKLNNFVNAYAISRRQVYVHAFQAINFELMWRSITGGRARIAGESSGGFGRLWLGTRFHQYGDGSCRTPTA